MALWGAPICEGRAAFYGPVHAATQVQPCRIELWRYRYNTSYATHDSLASHPAARYDPKLVHPADYVELRALENRKAWIEAETARCDSLSTAVPPTSRPWPFHQPLPEVQPLAAEPAPGPDPTKGHLLDIFA
jgi:hypothetical protein